MWIPIQVIFTWITGGYLEYPNPHKLKFNNLKYNFEFNNSPNNIK